MSIALASTSCLSVAPNLELRYEPARSTMRSLPTVFSSVTASIPVTSSVSTRCDRELAEFILVQATDRFFSPSTSALTTSSMVLMPRHLRFETNPSLVAGSIRSLQSCVSTASSVSRSMIESL